MFDYLAANAAGIWLLIAIALFGILATQWLSWIFRWGRFSEGTPQGKSIRFILAELATNIINEFGICWRWCWCCCSAAFWRSAS